MHGFRYIIFLFILIISTNGCRKVNEPPEPDTGIDFSGCIIPGTSSSLEIVTFNAEDFPKQGSLTVDAAARLIRTINPDVVALQEITSENAFNSLLRKLPGWSGQYYLINNSDWNLAFIFRDDEISFDRSSVKLLFEDDFYAFPRLPLEVKVMHKTTGIKTWLINLHLKCCGGSDNIARRRDAAQKLYSYIITERKNDPVIMLGDWNDEITANPSSSHPFYIFLNDSINFRYTDLPIARGTSLWWSYPSYPSHLDHILITDELFNHIDTTITYKPEPCYSSYSTVISDHRPVGVVLK